MDPQQIKEILKRVLSGDINAYEAIIEEYRSTVFKIVVKRIPASEVDSVAHDVFVRVYKSLGSFKAKSPFEHWLSRIAVRSCYDYWKAKERQGRMVERPLDVEHYEWLENVTHESAVNQFDSETARNEAVEVLEYALSRLDVDDRVLVELYYIEQWPMKEIATSLGWSLPKVKIKALRARKKLRTIINDMLEKETP